MHERGESERDGEGEIEYLLEEDPSQARIPSVA